MATPIVHVIKTGDTLVRIAQKYGVPKWQDIWNHKLNDALRSKRKKPEFLQAGDKLLIPSKDEGPAGQPRVQEETKPKGGNKEQLRKALEALRKARSETEKAFRIIEDVINKEFSKMMGKPGLDLVNGAKVAISLIVNYSGGPVMAVRDVLAFGVSLSGPAMNILKNLSSTAWWGPVAKKLATGDIAGAKTEAIRLVQSAKNQVLADIDKKIKELEKLAA